MNHTKNSENEEGYFAERPILLVAGLFVLASIPVGMLIVLMYGSVSGNEFSPDDFARRRFSYQQIPWLNWTISGIEYTDITPELEQSLTINGLVTKRKTIGCKQQTWHLYHDSGVPDSHACDARFLTAYLDFSDWDSGTGVTTPFWLKWNERFPLSAKIFWPTIADLARNEMYLIVPDVMRFAMNVRNDEPASFQSELNELTRASWVISGQSDLELGNFQRAAERFTRADLIDSSNELTNLIERCRNNLDDFSNVESLAKSAAKSLRSEIATALAEKNDSDSSDEDAKVEYETSAAVQGESLPDEISAEAIDPAVSDDPADLTSDPGKSSEP